MGRKHLIIKAVGGMTCLAILSALPPSWAATKNKKTEKTKVQKKVEAEIRPALPQPPPNPVAAEVQEYSFTPHISASARTGKPWSVAFQRAVGANINTNFLLGALTLSVLERVEVGTIPMFYFAPDHQVNATAKYNFWRGEQFNWAVATSILVFDLDTSTQDEYYRGKDIDIHVAAFQILLNYFPVWTDLKFGVNLNAIQTALQGEVDTLTYLYTLRTRYEWGLDISKSISDQFDATVGLGTQREAGISAYEDVHFGFGASGRWYRPKKFLSSPTLGIHYTPKTGEFQYLFSTSFY